MPCTIALGLVLTAVAGEPPDTWSLPRGTTRDTPEAERVFRLGDIDNLGFGWPEGFDPFSGEQTPGHAFPWEPEADDPAGTDVIMVVSSYRGEAGADGYTGSTERPANLPRTLVLTADTSGVQVQAIWLQFFVDDFQSPSYGSRYRVWLDGQRVPRIERLVNALDQSGPIGRLVTIPLLAEELPLLADGRLEVCMDDPETGAGDGFAFDFARVLVNPRAGGPRGAVTGTVHDAATGQPLAGAVVDAGGGSTTTGPDGRFRLAGITPGLLAVSASQPGYAQAVAATDLVAGAETDVELSLAPELSAIADELGRYGRVTLHGVRFASGSDQLTAEAEPLLSALLDALGANDDRIEVLGHTDSTGSEAYNLDLSKRRATSVASWLKAHGIAASRIEARGFGESQPMADNGSDAGKALNRRVEIVVGTATSGGPPSGSGAAPSKAGPTCLPAG